MPPSDSSRTMRGLAAALGVSRTTVSLALRNHPSIAEATRARVRLHAEQVGYRANPLVNALMAQVRYRSVKPNREAIAFLTFSRNAQEFRQSPTISLYFEGARLQAEKHGFRLEPFSVGLSGENSRRQARVLRTRGVRGVLLAPIAGKMVAEGMQLDWANQAVVALGYSFQQFALHRATHNHYTGVQTGYEQLRTQGYQRIGLVLTEQDLQRNRHYWLAGYLMAQEKFGGEPLKPFVIGSARQEKEFEQFLQQARPDALVGTHPDIALAWLAQLGRRVPEEIAYATLDLAPGDQPKLAGIRQDSEQTGAAAIDLLIAQLYANTSGVPATPHLLLIEGKWSPGRTAPFRTTSR